LTRLTPVTIEERDGVGGPDSVFLTITLGERRHHVIAYRDGRLHQAHFYQKQGRFTVRRDIERGTPRHALLAKHVQAYLQPPRGEAPATAGRTPSAN